MATELYASRAGAYIPGMYSRPDRGGEELEDLVASSNIFDDVDPEHYAFLRYGVGIDVELHRLQFCLVFVPVQAAFGDLLITSLLTLAVAGISG
ncbi:hypothetical protein OQA88_1792 [Cercophora sp. LCS_1]